MVVGKDTFSGPWLEDGLASALFGDFFMAHVLFLPVLREIV
jgi:hypothetical protein